MISFRYDDFVARSKALGGSYYREVMQAGHRVGPDIVMSEDAYWGLRARWSRESRYRQRATGNSSGKVIVGPTGQPARPQLSPTGRPLAARCCGM